MKLLEIIERQIFYSVVLHHFIESICLLSQLLMLSLVINAIPLYVCVTLNVPTNITYNISTCMLDMACLA